MINQNTKVYSRYSLYLGYLLPKSIKRVLLKNFDLVIKSPHTVTLPLLFFLKNNNLSKFEILVDITCCDMYYKDTRFVLIYNLLSIRYNLRVQLLTSLKESDNLFSAVSIFKGANWLEREV
jgi:NADH-quinone oxidoreductase subunit C